MKMLVVFKKSPRLRFIGHLDLMRTMQRALRRSDLPVCYSQGFNPHLLLNFASPLSVGISGEREIMEVPVEGTVDPQVFKDVFSAVLPKDFPCISVRAVEDQHAAPMALCVAASYTGVFDNEIPDLKSKIDQFLAADQINVVKKTKSGEKLVDIKTMIYSFNEISATEVKMTLSLCESATCKPELLLKAFSDRMGEELPPCRLVRTQLFGNDADTLIPLEDL